MNLFLGLALFGVVIIVAILGLAYADIFTGGNKGG